MQEKSLTRRDSELIWHPFTQHGHDTPMIAVSRGEGACLVDEKGKYYIDAISSWWTNLHGHAHPYIAGKIYEQARQLEHVIFAGCTHEPAVALAERLRYLLPGQHYSRFFYSDNGSTAVEVALKMAIQYWQNKGNPNRKKIIAFQHAYHGDTFGSMSVSDRGIFTLAFADYLFEVIFMETPSPDNIKQLQATLDEHAAETAAFIFEPLVQGAGGMRMYQPELLDLLVGQANQAGIICIADEVMTGFGRTGRLFASDYCSQRADLICLSKGLTGGSLPLALTACTKRIYEAFRDQDLYKTFFHGHSYTANPIACAAALASLDLLEDPDCTTRIQEITEAHTAFVQKWKGQPGILRPRSLGTILAFEFYATEHEYRNKVKEETMRSGLERGIFIRPLGNTVYVMPPYCITGEQQQQVYQFLETMIPGS